MVFAHYEPENHSSNHRFRTVNCIFLLLAGVQHAQAHQGMQDGALKQTLPQCDKGPFFKTDFSIDHRGAAQQFPEHSDVAYRAGARMGAGIVECDVTFIQDGELVRRHSECDLATTTNIVATPLNDHCTVPWTGPADAGYPAPVCYTSDLTLPEFKSLEAKMDASNPNATTPEGFLGGTAAMSLRA